MRKYKIFIRHSIKIISVRMFAQTWLSRCGSTRDRLLYSYCNLGDNVLGSVVFPPLTPRPIGWFCCFLFLPLTSSRGTRSGFRISSTGWWTFLLSRGFWTCALSRPLRGPGNRGFFRTRLVVDIEWCRCNAPHWNSSYRTRRRTVLWSSFVAHLRYNGHNRYFRTHFIRTLV